jgi:hypothetical protein
MARPFEAEVQEAAGLLPGSLRGVPSETSLSLFLFAAQQRRTLNVGAHAVRTAQEDA